jgi:hypothetical protein
MDDEKSLEKVTNKYLCMATGQKRMEPCDGCANPKGCLSRGMQYKETEEMDQQEEKAILKVSADGDVVSCAKGLDAKECGFKGGKVCGACGAMAVTSKMDGVMAEEVEDDEEDMSEDMDKKKKKAAMVSGSAELGTDEDEVEMDDEDDEDDESDESDEEMSMKKKAAPKKAMMPEGDMPEEEMPEADMPEEEEEDEDEEEMAEPKGYGMMKPNPDSRRRALQMAGGKKAADMDLDDSFLCQFSRKVLSNSTPVCENCPGGCMAEGELVGIADVEGMALDMFGGKVLASGYTGTEEDDFGNLFVVDILSKDGHAIEIIADGDTGELMNFHRLNTENLDIEMSQKSLEDQDDFAPRYVDIKTAEAIAMGVIENEIGTKGETQQADSDIFEGYDSWVFEINAVSGKSYDVFVGLDGTVLGYDEYDSAEAEDIEAEAAELALKRAYSEDEREALGKRGQALPDGSFPIKDVEDLKNAIQAFGRAKDKDKAKAHIMKRAMDLGKEDLIPENWVPKKVQDEAAGEKSEESQLMKDLMEFQMMAAEQDLDGLI